LSGVLQVGLDAADQLLHSVPAHWRLILGLPLVLLALVLVTSVLVRLFGPVLLKLASTILHALTYVIGLLLLLPEFAVSRGLRRLGQEPFGLLHIYGEAVEHLVTGGRQLFDGRLTRIVDDKKIRRGLVLLVAAGLFVVADSGSCDGHPGTTCATPGGQWWTAVVSSVHDTPAPTPSSPAPPTPHPNKPAPSPTRKAKG
jgi:hypothetical protein